MTGEVQGIGFRYYVRELARSLGVCGWVKNLSDGRVEAVFEGEGKRVEEMIKFCRRGPPSADVSDVEVKWEDYKGEFSDFEIRYGWRL